MKPIDFRNETFEALQGRLAGLREQVWLDWLAWEVRHGLSGATTRQVCEYFKRDIPQIPSPLHRAVSDGHPDPDRAQKRRKGEKEKRRRTRSPSAPLPPLPLCGSHEGIYVTRPLELWREWIHGQRAAAIGRQLQLAV